MRMKTLSNQLFVLLWPLLSSIVASAAAKHHDARMDGVGGRKLEDDIYAPYLHGVRFEFGIKVPVTLTCGYLKNLPPSMIEEECSKTLELDGYAPAKDVCVYTCANNEDEEEKEGGGDDIFPIECEPRTICEKGATEMKYKVTGATCDESDNTQEDKFTCTDHSTVSFPAFIELSAKGSVYFSGMVEQGEVITLSNGGDKFAADTNVVVKESSTGATYQSFTFHTSCSQNLFIGDTFGTIQLLQFTNSVQGTISCEPEYECVDEDGKFLYKVANVDGNEVAVLKTCEWLSSQKKCKIDEICTDESTVPGVAHAKDTCPVTCQTCPVEQCGEKEECLERPTMMKFEVSGADCSANDNDQGGKYICEDFSSISFPAKVFMRSTKSSDAVYFDGVVSEMGQVIEATNGGKQFDADMIVEISSVSGILYQALQYHSSCSQNLFIGDIFGGVQLVSLTNGKQGTIEVCKDPDPPEREPCEDGCPLETIPEYPWSIDEINELEQCCSELIDEEDRPSKDLCCNLLEDAPPSYCVCQAPYPDLPYTDAEQEVLEECCNSDDPPPTTVCCSLDNPPPYCACTAPYPDLPYTDAEQVVLEECCNSDDPPPSTVCCSLDNPPPYCACTAPYPDAPFTDEEQDVLEECCNSDDPPPSIVCCSLDNPPPYCACTAPYPDAPFTDEEQEVLEECCNGDDPPPTTVCCLLDDPPGYCIPSQVPSDPPSDVPTEAPTILPSEEPSPAPTPAPTSCSELCVGNEEQSESSFLLALEKVDGIDIPIIKTCGWLMSKQDARKEAICSSYDAYLGFLSARDVCIYTCGRCPCSDEPSYSPSSKPTVVPSQEVTIQQMPTPSPTRSPSTTPSAAPNVCVPCEVLIDPECPYECEREVCTERPQHFYFKFSGGTCDESQHTQEGKFTCEDLAEIDSTRSHYLVFKSTKDDTDIYFEGWVKPNEVVTLSHNGKFQADMKVDVYSGFKTFLKQTLVYHSSCSQNLFNGDIFGAVTLVGFKSYSQDLKCRPTNCDCDPNDVDCVPPCDSTMCTETPEQFFFRLDGGSCDQSSNHQSSYKFTCEETYKYDASLGKWVEFTDIVGSEVYFKGWVTPKGIMTLTSQYGFPTEMMIRIWTGPKKEYPLQVVQYHSSCSSGDIYNGDSFGAVTLVGFKSYYQYEKCF